MKWLWDEGGIIIVCIVIGVCAFMAWAINVERMERLTYRADINVERIIELEGSYGLVKIERCYDDKAIRVCKTYLKDGRHYD